MEHLDFCIIPPDCPVIWQLPVADLDAKPHVGKEVALLKGLLNF